MLEDSEMKGLYPFLGYVAVLLPVLSVVKAQPDTMGWTGSESSLDTVVKFAATILSCRAKKDAEIVKRHTVDESTAMDMGDGEVFRGGGLVRFAHCRQIFQTDKVFYGKSKVGDRVLEYSYVEMSEAFPMEGKAIPKNAKVIVVLDNEDRIIKALPDTEENRKAVALALSRCRERKKAY
jgi:hypothetical protein